MVWLLLVVVTTVTWGMTGLLRNYALSRRLVDVPNERSSHSVPTPRGGGVAIVFSFLMSVLFLWSAGSLNVMYASTLVGSGLLIAITGFIDDHGHVPARWRLIAHFIAAIWSLYWLGGLPAIKVFGDTYDLSWAGHALAAVYIVWLLNLYNFMDGIDGIASIEAITVCFGGLMLFLLGSYESASYQLLIFTLIAAIFGFIIWNFPPAKIFMGDAGSGFIGLILGLFSIMAAHIDQALFWAWVIMLGAFVVDATLTLFRRVLKGKAFYEAHRSHAYQYLSRKWKTHKLVSLLFGAINLIWLLPVAAAVVLGLIDGVVGVIFAYIPLILLAYWLKAGDADSQ